MELPIASMVAIALNASMASAVIIANSAIRRAQAPKSAVGMARIQPAKAVRPYGHHPRNPASTALPPDLQ